MQLSAIAKLAFFLFSTAAVAHPGEHEERDVLADLAKREFYSGARRSLDSCASKMESRGIHARAQARRRATVERFTKRKVVRDTDAIANESHHSSLTIEPIYPDPFLFSSNSTCILNPEGETGPYWIKGEQIRSHLSEGQAGIPVIIDGQFVNVETCEPITDLWWDLWNCNATGVYSGLVATGNGNAADTSNFNATFLRGLQQTDEDGVAQFHTLFPGHYSGRTNHMHMIAHTNATVLPNDTISGGNVAHVGQIFWDQDLIYQVEATYPYNTNNISITTNVDDHVFIAETETDSDPVLEYVMLGDTLEDGLFAWITIAVNVSASYDPNYSYVYTASGGVAESGGTDSGNGGSGGGNGTAGGPGNGTAPSGAMPSGVAPTSAA